MAVKEIEVTPREEILLPHFYISYSKIDGWYTTVSAPKKDGVLVKYEPNDNPHVFFSTRTSDYPNWPQGATINVYLQIDEPVRITQTSSGLLISPQTESDKFSSMILHASIDDDYLDCIVTR